LGKLIDALINPEKYNEQLGKTAPRIIKYKLPVACAAVLVHLRGETFTRRMMAQMQSGTFDMFNEQFGILSHIKTEFGRRFGNASESD
jgi:hypothetical protein